jgi:hypothetical protein
MIYEKEQVKSELLVSTSLPECIIDNVLSYLYTTVVYKLDNGTTIRLLLFVEQFSLSEPISEHFIPTHSFGREVQLFLKNKMCIGLFHSENDDPGVTLHNGDKFWYHYGHFHRDNDKPAEIISEETIQGWWKNGFRHRRINPALIFYPYSGRGKVRLAWYNNGKRQYSRIITVLDL